MFYSNLSSLRLPSGNIVCYLLSGLEGHLRLLLLQELEPVDGQTQVRLQLQRGGQQILQEYPKQIKMKFGFFMDEIRYRRVAPGSDLAGYPANTFAVYRIPDQVCTLFFQIKVDLLRINQKNLNANMQMKPDIRRADVGFRPN